MKKNFQLNLSDAERKQLRKNKVKKADIRHYAPDELEVLLDISPERAREIFALVDFQRIPSIGIKFAEDLIFLGYHSIAEIKGKSGAELTDTYERKKGFRTDVCVEDQFRLAAYVAKTNDYTKKWWDFTAERKQYRQERGYPADRPVLNWFEVNTSN